MAMPTFNASGRLCGTCGHFKPWGDFSLHRNCPNGRNTKCKECCIAAQKERLKTAEGKARQRTSERVARKKNNKHKLMLLRRYLRLLGVEFNEDRILVVSISYTGAEWARLCDWFGGVCLACGACGELAVDHVIPVVLGGVDHITNLQPLCLSCNGKKGTQIKDYRDPDRLAAFLRSLLES